jgi:galactonate dehydratase
MLRESFWGLGGGPVIYSAMSAIDTALWDIKAKSLNLPVYQLLGGKTNASLKCYASQIQFDWDKEVTNLWQPPDLAAAAKKAVDEGYVCLKVDPIMFGAEGERFFDRTNLFTPFEIRLFKSRLEAIRDAVGMDIDLILECHGLLGVNSAIQVEDIAEEFNCLFYEEPVNYLNNAIHKKVSERVKTPLAGGERLYTRYHIRPYLEDQSIALLQPDIGLCGGFTEAKKICDYADSYDVKIQAHVCGSPVATAALHLETAISNFLIHEHHSYALKEWNRELCLEDLQPVNGHFQVSEAPGLGIHLNDAVVKRSPFMEIK